MGWEEEGRQHLKVREYARGPYRWEASAASLGRAVRAAGALCPRRRTRPAGLSWGLRAAQGLRAWQVRRAPYGQCEGPGVYPSERR